MIKVQRCAEPAQLAVIRKTKLAELRLLGREPHSNEIEGYRFVANDLWKSQHHKCCYCEVRIPQGYNDVEHYRPKASADRMPGCSYTHGYWWLAFSWENLLFSCPDCNRSHKNTRFPLDLGGQTLRAESIPPGNEKPLLIDPSSKTNPVEHIEFVYQRINNSSTNCNWWARPRNGSPLGNSTIEVCGLNRSDLLEMREDYYVTAILPHCHAINESLTNGDIPRLKSDFNRAIGLLAPRNIHVGLTYDVLRHLVPEQDLLKKLGMSWPTPNLVAP